MSGVQLLKANPPPDTSVDYSSAIGEFVIGLSPIQGYTPLPGTDIDDASSKPDGIDRFLDTVQSRLPGVTMPLIQLELQNVIEEFCYRSLYFRQQVYWQLAIGASQVTITPVDGRMETIYVIHVHGLPSYRVDPPATLVDLQSPNSTRTGDAWIVMRPRNWAAVQSGATPTLFSNWFEVMLDGALFRLYGQPAKPWSSQGLAQYHGTRWWQGVNRARDQAERLNSSQQSPWRKTPYWAHGRRKN